MSDLYIEATTGQVFWASTHPTDYWEGDYFTFGYHSQAAHWIANAGEKATTPEAREAIKTQLANLA